MPVTGATADGAASVSAGAGAGRLRVVFCTRGGWFGELVRARLEACGQIELCGIVRSSRVYHRDFGFIRGALAYLRRSGLAYSLYLLCATDIAQALCALARGRRAAATDTPSAVGGRRHIPVHTTRDLNDEEGLRFLRACAPDLLVSAFFDQPLREPALAVAASGSINIHPSLLPCFRGVDPVLQARLQRAPRIGVTVHHMTPALDTGNILGQEAIAAPSRGSVFEITALLFDRGAQLLIDALDRIRQGDPGMAQQEGGSYESWPTPAEVRALSRLGIPLIRVSDLSRILRPGRTLPSPTSKSASATVAR